MAENKITLADVVAFAGPESQVTMLGDAEHNNIQQALALMSPEVIQAAAKAGKKFVILEAFSDPIFEEAYTAFAKGEVSENRLREWCNGIASNTIFDADLPRYKEGFFQALVAMKQAEMTLLSTNRKTEELLPTETAHPEFAEYLQNSLAALQSGGEEALRQFEQKIIQERGASFISSYNAWVSGEWQQQMNERDYKVVNTAIDRANGQGVLIVWGNDHNQQKNDLNEAIGVDRTRVIGVYPNTHAPQITRNNILYRQDMPAYIYYVEEGMGGRPDPVVNISTAPMNLVVNNMEQLDSIKHNSLAGVLDPTFKFPHVEHDPSEMNMPSPLVGSANKNANDDRAKQ